MTLPRVGLDYWQHFGQRLVDLTNIYPGSLVLDVGTGGGSSQFPAAKKLGPRGHVVGIDISDQWIQQTYAGIQNKKLTNASVIQMDGHSLAFRDHTFDLVLCGFLITSLYRYDQQLLELNRVLKKKGRVAFSSWEWQEDNEWLADLVHRHFSDMLPGDLGYIGQQGYGWMVRTFLEIMTPPRYVGEIIQYDRQTPNGLATILQSAGFQKRKIITERVKVVFKDEAEWWHHMMSIGWRDKFKKLERLGPDRLARLKQEVQKELQSAHHADGIAFTRSVILAFGTK